MAVDKCEPGYIASRKKISFLWLFLFLIIGIAIFLVGYLITHTRANIFTVIAVLMSLPAAKRIVNLVVMLPRKSVDRERFDRAKEAAGEGTLLADYVFTSTERIMHLDFVAIKGRSVLALTAPSRQDVSYMKKYFADMIRRAAPDYEVRILDEYEEFLRCLKDVPTAPDDIGDEGREDRNLDSGEESRESRVANSGEGKKTHQASTEKLAELLHSMAV